MAKHFCDADHNANVLIVILELCTLHLKFREETDFLLSGSLFADGAPVSWKLPETTRF